MQSAHWLFHTGNCKLLNLPLSNEATNASTQLAPTCYEFHLGSLECATMAFSVSKLHHNYKTYKLRNLRLLRLRCCRTVYTFSVLSLHSHSYTHKPATILCIWHTHQGMINCSCLANYNSIIHCNGKCKFLVSHARFVFMQYSYAMLANVERQHASADIITAVCSIFKDAGNNTEYWAWADYRIVGNICGNCVVQFYSQPVFNIDGFIPCNMPAWAMHAHTHWHVTHTFLRCFLEDFFEEWKSSDKLWQDLTVFGTIGVYFQCVTRFLHTSSSAFFTNSLIVSLSSIIVSVWGEEDVDLKYLKRVRSLDSSCGLQTRVYL